MTFNNKAPEAADLANEGRGFTTAGDLETAQAVFLRAWLMQPTALHALEAAAAAINAGCVRSGDVLLKRVAALRPDLASAWNLIGQCALYLADPRRAWRAYGRALTLSYDMASEQITAGQGRARAAAYLSARPSPARRGTALYVRGNFGGVSGYGHMTMRFEAALNQAGRTVNRMDLVGGESREAFAQLRAPAKTLISMMTPVSLEPLAGAGNLLFSMFEGTRVSSAWRRHSERADLVITPTRSSFNAWVEAGYDPNRVRICPLGVDLPFTEIEQKLILQAPGGKMAHEFRRRFINISDVVARKNLSGLFRVWLRVTRNSDDVVLIVKVGKGSLDDRRIISKCLQQAIDNVKVCLENAAPIIFVEKRLSDTQMLSLLSMGTHYWSMSCGEGWDLPLTQAGALGLEVLAPRHSAYLDYLDEDVAELMPVRLSPAIDPLTGAPCPAFFGSEWWVPDEEAAGVAVRRAIDEQPAGRGAALAARLVGQYSWQAAVSRLINLLKETGLS